MLRLPRKDGEAVRTLAKETANVFAGIGTEYRLAAFVLFVQEAGNELDSYDQAFAEMIKDALGDKRPTPRAIPKPSIN